MVRNKKTNGRCRRGVQHLPSRLFRRACRSLALNHTDCRGLSRDWSGVHHADRPCNSVLLLLCGLLGFLLRSLGCFTFLCHIRHLLSEGNPTRWLHGVKRNLCDKMQSRAQSCRRSILTRKSIESFFGARQAMTPQRFHCADQQSCAARTCCATCYSKFLELMMSETWTVEIAKTTTTLGAWFREGIKKSECANLAENKPKTRFFQ